VRAAIAQALRRLADRIDPGPPPDIDLLAGLRRLAGEDEPEPQALGAPLAASAPLRCTRCEIVAAALSTAPTWHLAKHFAWAGLEPYSTAADGGVLCSLHALRDGHGRQ